MVTPSGLLVLDIDELTLRCRSCDWVSPACTTVEDAERAFAAHTCSPGEIAPEAARPGRSTCAIASGAPTRHRGRHDLARSVRGSEPAGRRRP